MLNSLLFVLLFILWNKSFADVGNEQDIWNASNSPSKSWTSITMSAAGQFAAAATSNGPIYLSTDSGISWSQSSAPTERSGWLQIVSSQSCQYLAAITNDGPGNDIYLSANYGDTWVQAVTPDVYQWLCIASSASGQILVAGTAQSGTQAGGGIYISKDYGSTFTQTTAPSSNIFWASVTMSANGSFIFGSQLTYTGGSTGLPSYVFRSLNGGDTWQPTSLPPIGTGFLFGALASDYESKFLYTVVTDLTLYLGFNYGEDWTVLTVSPTPWKSLACSGDGKYAAATTEDAVHLSETFGVTWNSQIISTSGGVSWAPVAVNGSGLFKLAGQADNGLIYRGFYNSSYNHSAVSSSSSVPTIVPSAVPSYSPSAIPSIEPSLSPSVEPSAELSMSPSTSPSMSPTTEPSVEPSVSPSAVVVNTDSPSITPTASPSSVTNTSPQPTIALTQTPSFRPSAIPTTNNNATSSSSGGQSNFGIGTTGEFVLVIVFCVTAVFLLGLGAYFLRKYLSQRDASSSSNGVDAWDQNAIRRSEMKTKSKTTTVTNPINSMNVRRDDQIL